MAKGNSYEDLAAEAAVRIQQAVDAGKQLTFLPDEAVPGEGDRAKRGKGKATSQMREWLAAQGFRQPEDVLTEMAGMASGEDAFLTAMAATERFLLWAEAGGRTVVEVIKDGVLIERELDNRATTVQRLAAFQFMFTAQLRAAEALLPYGRAKVTPDQGATVVNNIIMPGARVPAPAARGPEGARDVTPQARRITPPPLPGEIVQNQGLGEAVKAGSDDTFRTEGVKR